MLYDEYLKFKEKKRDKLYLLKRGNFYVTYDMDSIIINNLFGYKIKKFKKYSIIGFPISSLEKVKDKLDESSIDYLVYNFKENEILYNNEPKERIIRKLEYKDRIVHQWYIYEFIKPYFVPRFIYDSYACIDNKGTHKAIYRLQKFMRIMKREYINYYVIKCDIRKFFYNINTEILFDILGKYIDDKYLLEFTRKLIYENNDEDGLPIGNYTSQYFANIYLNELDYYVKYDLKCKYYLRYMDDFIILTKDKESAKDILNKITEFLNTKLKL